MALVEGEELRASILNGGIFSLFQSPSQSVDEVFKRFGFGDDSGVISCTPSSEESHVVDDDDSLGASRFPSTVLRCERVCMMTNDKERVSWTL